MWLRFTAAFDWSPPEFNGWVTTAYAAGMRCSVTSPCGLKALIGKVAVKIPTPGREEAEALKADPFWRADG